METYQNIIGPDCWNIIMYYKNEFERIEFNKKTIDNCIFEDDKTSFEPILNSDNTIIENRYHFNNITIDEFKRYYLSQKYILTTTFKFTINNEGTDHIGLVLNNIKSDYLKNLKISYIYKLNAFKLCVFIRDFKENELNKLYDELAKNYITDSISHYHHFS